MNRSNTPQASDIRHSSFVIIRRALTLVEMLIGMAITLLMMAAIVNLFANISSGVKVRRATMRMSDELRTVRAKLYEDLAGATCRPLPWQRPDEDSGYLEIIEGKYSDRNPSSLVTEGNIETVNGLNSRTSLVPRDNDGRLVQFVDTNNNGVYDSGTDTWHGNVSALGDFDDVLALTVQNKSSKYQGKAYNFAAGQQENIYSNFAEVVWFAVENPADGSLGEPGMRTLYRRVMLVAPWLDPIDLTAYPTDGSSLAADDALAFYRRFDISARFDPATSKWIPNSLGDLTKRENRFAHFFDVTDPDRGYPHPLLLGAIRTNSYVSPPADSDGVLRPYGSTFENLPPNEPDREGEDIMLSNLMAFDLLVFDPGAPLFEYKGAVVEPVSDSMFSTTHAINPNKLVGFGAYVDLGWDNGSLAGPLVPDYDYTAFSGATLPSFQQEHQVGWHPNFPNNFRNSPVTYDTWSYHYEHDGIDQDNDGLIDEGANGLDDDGANGVDDIYERETSPPYPSPLRAMQVKLRLYEPDTRQIREATVTRSFVPQ